MIFFGCCSKLYQRFFFFGIDFYWVYKTTYGYAVDWLMVKHIMFEEIIFYYTIDSSANIDYILVNITYKIFVYIYT